MYQRPSECCDTVPRTSRATPFATRRRIFRVDSCVFTNPILDPAHFEQLEERVAAVEQRERELADRRRDVVVAATVVFADKGFHDAQMAEIAGTADQWVPAADLEALAAVGVEVGRYEGADHGFVHDPDRPAHRADDAADAWRRALAHLAG